MKLFSSSRSPRTKSQALGTGKNLVTDCLCYEHVVLSQALRFLIFCYCIIPSKYANISSFVCFVFPQSVKCFLPYWKGSLKHRSWDGKYWQIHWSMSAYFCFIEKDNWSVDLVDLVPENLRRAHCRQEEEKIVDDQNNVDVGFAIGRSFFFLKDFGLLHWWYAPRESILKRPSIY